MNSISVCMGSSCFSRGSSSNAEVIQNFIQMYNLSESVEICGSLCEGSCKKGPNLTINGKTFSNITPEALFDLLHHELEIEK